MGKVVVKVAVWFVIFIILITLGLEMISAPNTIENVNGTILGPPQYMSILLMYRPLTMSHLQSMQRMVQSSL